MSVCCSVVPVPQVWREQWRHAVCAARGGDAVAVSQDVQCWLRATVTPAGVVRVSDSDGLESVVPDSSGASSCISCTHRHWCFSDNSSDSSCSSCNRASIEQRLTTAFCSNMHQNAMRQLGACCPGGKLGFWQQMLQLWNHSTHNTGHKPSCRP